MCVRRSLRTGENVLHIISNMHCHGVIPLGQRNAGANGRKHLDSKNMAMNVRLLKRTEQE
jgi:hypothetical protein